MSLGEMGKIDSFEKIVIVKKNIGTFILKWVLGVRIIVVCILLSKYSVNNVFFKCCRVTINFRFFNLLQMERGLVIRIM